MTASAFKDHYQVLILGGGTAGITVAAQLRRKLKTYDVAVVEGDCTRGRAATVNEFTVAIRLGR